MSATSATGTGPGDSGKKTVTELAILANAPSIIFAGKTNITGLEVSPPSVAGNTVTFPYVLPGAASNYIVLLTTINGGHAYVTDTNEDDDGNFTGFVITSESSGTVMYMVARIGSRQNI